MAKNSRPMAVSASNSGQTTLSPASRNRIAALRLTKCVDGEPCMTHCSQCGMLSSGVLPPDSSSIGMITGIASKPNCGVERARFTFRGDDGELRAGEIVDVHLAYQR